MKIRLTIGKKIGFGFGVLIICTMLVFYITNNTLNESREINDKINNIYNPSVSTLEELKLKIIESKMLIYKWVAFPSESDNPEKKKLNHITTEEYQHISTKLKNLSKHWREEDRAQLDSTLLQIDNLFVLYDDVKALLPDFDSYNDSQNRFMANFAVDENSDIHFLSNQILWNLNDLINNQKHQTSKVSAQMLKSFDLLQFLIRYLGLALVVGGVLVAFYTTRSIVSPIHKLKQILLELSVGKFPKSKLEERHDEIGEMTQALNILIDALESTRDFADELGKGNFNATYTPLSEEDSMGYALLKMRDALAENERVLEQKVKERTAEVVRQKEEIEEQNLKISELYTEVTDSIRYAKRIQEAILPPAEVIKKYLPESFVLYRPKDIVSGDFYWFETYENKSYLAAVDCTGHGVPGAFMSIVGYNILNYALSSTKGGSPAQILDVLNKGVSNTLHKTSNVETKDGMDVAMCTIHHDTNILEYAGAYNPLYIVRDNEVLKIKADKFPIGSYHENPNLHYSNHKIELKKGDAVYIFSDGYADQFGGPKGKKLMYKRFREILLEIVDLPAHEQQKRLLDYFLDWKGSLEQVDDILILGFKY